MGTNAREIGDFSTAVSAELRGAIAKAGFSVRAFAREAHMPITTLHKTLRAERVVDVEDLAQICDYLGLHPSEIIEKVEHELAKRQRVVPDTRYSNRGDEDATIHRFPTPTALGRVGNESIDEHPEEREGYDSDFDNA